MKKLEQIINKSPKPYVLLVVGPPLSGKSTLISTLKDCTVICRDSIILELHGSNDYEEAYKSLSHKEVDKKYKKMILDSSKKRENVVIDMTNLTAKRRRSNLTNFGKDYTKIAVVFDKLSDKEFELHNEKRKLEENKFISKKLYEFMCESYQKVEKSEGFNNIIYM